MKKDTSIDDNEPCRFPEARQRLLEMLEKDQWVRTEADFSQASTHQRVNQIDYDNYQNLRQILETIKSPSVDNIGNDGAQAVFLIAQHSAFDIAFMEEVLDLMQECAETDKDSTYYLGIPYLIDRLKMIKGQEQVYGTQFVQLSNSEHVPYPIEDEKNVDKRRSQYGLEPLEDYKVTMGLSQGGK